VVALRNHACSLVGAELGTRAAVKVGQNGRFRFTHSGGTLNPASRPLDSRFPLRASLLGVLLAAVAAIFLWFRLFPAHPSEAPSEIWIRHARIDAHVIRAAAELWRSDRPLAECPNVRQLKVERFLDAGATE
jgi:hypothetical protein